MQCAGCGSPYLLVPAAADLPGTTTRPAGSAPAALDWPPRTASCWTHWPSSSPPPATYDGLSLLARTPTRLFGSSQMQPPTSLCALGFLVQPWPPIPPKPVLSRNLSRHQVISPNHPALRQVSRNLSRNTAGRHGASARDQLLPHSSTWTPSDRSVPPTPCGQAVTAARLTNGPFVVRYHHYLVSKWYKVRLHGNGRVHHSMVG